MSKHLTKLKRLPKFSYLKEIGSSERIDRTYQRFFDNLKRKVRCSPPKFKKVRRYKSFTLKQAGWKLDESTRTLTINKQNYRYFRSRRISDKIKTVTIKHDSLRDIYVYVVTDATDFKVETRTGKIVGFDFGLKKFLTASDGNDIISPFFLARNAKLICKACRRLSRKAKNSNNRERTRLELARLYKKTANQRHDFHFKLAHQLCLEYDTIFIEDLNIKGMQKLYGRKMGDLVFSEFVYILKYDAPKFGTAIVEIDRYYASSQICHCCGEKNPAVKDLNIK